MSVNISMVVGFVIIVGVVVSTGVVDEGVVVDIYAKGYEDCDCLASCYAFDMDALFMQEETDEEKDLEVD